MFLFSFIFGAALTDLLISTLLMSSPTLKWDSATIVGSIAAGLMTIFAGWLAFREAQISNQSAHITQKKVLLLENLKAVNFLSNEFTKVFKQLHAIDVLSLRNIPLSEVVGKPQLFTPDEIKRAADKTKEMIPRIIDLMVVGDSLVILPVEATRETNKINDRINDLQKAFLSIYPATVSVNVNDLAWRNALLTLYLPDENSLTRIQHLKKVIGETLSYLDNFRTTNSTEYNKIVSSYLGEASK